MNEKQLLQTIEIFCNEDYLTKNGEAKTDVIYTWVHSFLAKEKCGCPNPHSDWFKDAKEFYDYLVKEGEINPVENKDR